MSKIQPRKVKIEALVEQSCSQTAELKDCSFGLKEIQPRCQFCTRFKKKVIETKEKEIN